MSIEFSLKLKGGTIDEKLLINEINKLGVSSNISKVEGDILEINSTYDLLGFIVTIIKNKKPPYNVYETSFLETDFEYNQVILFEFNKEADLNTAYSKVFELIFSLMKEIKTSALLTSSAHDAICYFENNTNVHVDRTGALLEKIQNINGINDNWRIFYN
ncbi:MAG: hypothetical protein N3B21_05075 [Clostridia bacterium]|nr:hypothetical protein [Clostridia bacterium]